jgi:hypothetical protein
MTVSECRRYINYIADLADRELIDALIRGNQVTWVLFDRDAGRLLQDALDKRRSTDVLVRDLFARQCLPVVRRESGVVPATTIPTTDRTQAIKQLNEAVKEMARQMLGQGEQIEWTLDIKSMSSKKENVHLNGPMEL